MNRYDIALGKPPPKKPVQKIEQVKTKSPTKSPQITQEQRLEIYRDFMRTEEGRQRLATSMVEPLRDRLNARSFARRIFNVDRLPNGALPSYDKSQYVRGYVVDEDGEHIIELSTDLSRVILPIFPISSVQRTRLTTLRDQMQPSRNSRNPLDNTMDAILLDLVREEETRAIELLGETDPNHQRIINILNIYSFNSEILVNAMLMIERMNLRVAYILINPEDFLVMRSIFSRDCLDLNVG
jgi:hypothetical protein